MVSDRLQSGDSELDKPAFLRMFGLVISERCTSFDGKLGRVVPVRTVRGTTAGMQEVEHAGGRSSEPSDRGYWSYLNESWQELPAPASPSVQIPLRRRPQSLIKPVYALHLSWQKSSNNLESNQKISTLQAAWPGWPSFRPVCFRPLGRACPLP